MHEDAMEFVTEVVGGHRATAEQVTEKVHDPLLAALLVGKATVAAERGVSLRMAPGTLLPDRLVDSRGLVTAVGNLVDNALDAAAGSDGAVIEVGLRTDGRTVVLQVRDSGKGALPSSMNRSSLRAGRPRSSRRTANAVWVSHWYGGWPNDRAAAPPSARRRRAAPSSPSYCRRPSPSRG